jgi:actin-related protein
MQAQYYIGDEALSKWNLLTLVYPVVRGLVTNWTAFREVRNGMTK